MKSRAGYFTTLTLIGLIGILVAVLRHMDTGVPFLPGQERSVWLVEARIDFEALDGEVTASLSLPERQVPGFELFDEQAASQGYGFSILSKPQGRRAEWTRREARGSQSLYYSAQFVESGDPRVRTKLRQLSATELPIIWDEAEELAADAMLARAREMSSSPHSLARELIKQLNDSSVDQNAALLRIHQVGGAELLMQLLQRAGIESRFVSGLYLEDARRRQTLTPMVEVFHDGQWLLFNPATGEEGVPDNLLLWHRGGISVLDVTGGRDSSLSFSMIRQSVPATYLASVTGDDSIFARLGVHRLPIEEQSMFKLLLLLPLGATVVVLMRVIVGLKTAGTFMPILISLAFLQTSLLPGLVSFISVVGIGLILRGYLSRLNLLLVARIATLIVLVVFIISAMSIIGFHMGYSTGMTITFFPMIIMAWTIERMSILWEEEGAYEVLMQGGGSLAVAVIAYLLMQLTIMQHLSFNFPELNLVLLALILALGQYTGYKLTELRRFRAMEELQ